mgnify:CR=1 FL=1
MYLDAITSLDGKKSTEITNSNGWANSKLTADTSGNYDVKVTFKGDSDYNGVYQVEPATSQEA